MTISNIQSPKYEGDFALWKCKMEVFFRTNFDIMLFIKYGLEMPTGMDGEKLKEHRQTKKQWENFTANGKVEYYLLSVLFVWELNRIGRYNWTKELQEKLLEFTKEPQKQSW